MGGAQAIVAQLSFTPMMLLVNNSAPRSSLGAVNGLGQSMASIARAVGPAVGGALWSVGTVTSFIYINFIALTVLTVATLVFSLYLPRSLEKLCSDVVQDKGEPSSSPYHSSLANVTRSETSAPGEVVVNK